MKPKSLTTVDILLIHNPITSEEDAHNRPYMHVGCITSSGHPVSIGVGHPPLLNLHPAEGDVHVGYVPARLGPRRLNLYASAWSDREIEGEGRVRLP